MAVRLVDPVIHYDAVYVYRPDPWGTGHRVRSTVGFQPRCQCGDRGPRVASVTEARRWGQAHVVAVHR